MKGINELKAIVTEWYNKNKGESIVASAFAFKDSVTENGFQIVRCKDVKEGLSIRLESGDNYIDGIFVFSTEQMVCKESFENELGSTVFRGASID